MFIIFPLDSEFFVNVVCICMYVYNIVSTLHASLINVGKQNKNGNFFSEWKILKHI